MIIHDDEREYQDWAARLTDRVDRISGDAAFAWCLAIYLLALLVA